MSHDQCAAVERDHHRPHLGVAVMVNIHFDAERADFFVNHGFLLKLVGGLQIEPKPERKDNLRRAEENLDFHLISDKRADALGSHECCGRCKWLHGEIFPGLKSLNWHRFVSRLWARNLSMAIMRRNGEGWLVTRST